MTAQIPHPYPDGLAEKWIAGHPARWEKGNSACFAITRRDGGLLLGAISLVNIADGTAELGYWLGVDGWGHGYMTEACREILRFAAEDLRLRRVEARVLARNPASGRVLEKVGLRYLEQIEGACGDNHSFEKIELYEYDFGVT